MQSGKNKVICYRAAILILLISVGILGHRYMEMEKERDMALRKYYDVVALYNQQIPPGRNQLRLLENTWDND